MVPLLVWYFTCPSTHLLNLLFHWSISIPSQWSCLSASWPVHVVHNMYKVLYLDDSCHPLCSLTMLVFWPLKNAVFPFLFSHYHWYPNNLAFFLTIPHVLSWKNIVCCLNLFWLWGIQMFFVSIHVLQFLAVSWLSMNWWVIHGLIDQPSDGLLAVSRSVILH